MEEATNLRNESSRLAIAREDLRRLERELSVFEEVYGVTLPPPSEPRVTGSETSAQLRVIVDAIESATGETEAELRRERDRIRRLRLAERLSAVIDGTPAPPPSVTARVVAESVAPSASMDAAEPEAAADRARRYLSQLDPGAELSPVFLELSETLAKAENSANGQIAADALQAEIGRLNRELRDHTRATEALRDIRIRAGSLETRDPGLDALIAVAMDAQQRHQPVDLGPIAKAVSAAEVESRERRDAAYVSTALVDILSTLGYEQMGTFDTVVPENGALLRKPDWNDHGVLVRVSDEEVSMLVVRTTVNEDTATARVQDVAAENDFCEDLPVVLEKFGEHGITSDVQRQVPPDILKVRTLEGAPASSKPVKKRKSAKTKPKEKFL